MFKKMVYSDLIHILSNGFIIFLKCWKIIKEQGEIFNAKLILSLLHNFNIKK